MSVRRLHHEQPDSFEFTPENLAWAKKVIERYPEGRQASAVIPILWRAQEQNNGWVSEPAIRVVAELLDMPNIRVLEVATFYTQFQLKPVGKKAHIQVCGTTPCRLCGSQKIIDVCKNEINEQQFELSEDGDFSWEEVECLGACVNAPMVQISKDTYEDLTEESFRKLLKDIEEGRPVTPGPQKERWFAEPEGGATALTEVEDDTQGTAPVASRIDGTVDAANVYAGASINDGGAGYTGVPRPAQAGVDDFHVAFAAAQKAKAEQGEG